MSVSVSVGVGVDMDVSPKATPSGSCCPQPGSWRRYQAPGWPECRQIQGKASPLQNSREVSESLRLCQDPPAQHLLGLGLCLVVGEGISIWAVDPVKQVLPRPRPQSWWPHPPCWGPDWHQRRRTEALLPTDGRAGTWVFSCPRRARFRVLQTRLGPAPPAPLGLQLQRAAHGTAWSP